MRECFCKRGGSSCCRNNLSHPGGCRMGQLNFHRKLPSEIQRTEAIPTAEAVKSFQNATVEYSNGTWYVVWRNVSSWTTKAEIICSPKLGIGQVEVSKDSKTFVPVKDSEQTYMAYSAFCKIVNNKRGLNWCVESMVAAKRLHDEAKCA